MVQFTPFVSAMDVYADAQSRAIQQQQQQQQLQQQQAEAPEQLKALYLQNQIRQNTINDSQATDKQRASTQAILTGQGQAAPSLLQQSTPQPVTGQQAPAPQPVPQVDPVQQIDAQVATYMQQVQQLHKTGDISTAGKLEEEINRLLDSKTKIQKQTYDTTEKMLQHMADGAGSVYITAHQAEADALASGKSPLEAGQIGTAAGQRMLDSVRANNEQYPSTAEANKHIPTTYSSLTSSTFQQLSQSLSSAQEKLALEKNISDMADNKRKNIADTKKAQSEAITANIEANNRRNGLPPTPEDPSKVMEYYDKRQAALEEQSAARVAKLENIVDQKYPIGDITNPIATNLWGAQPIIKGKEEHDKQLSLVQQQQAEVLQKQKEANEAAKQKALGGRTPPASQQGGKIVDQTTLQNYATKHGIPIDKATEFLKGQGYVIK